MTRFLRLLGPLVLVLMIVGFGVATAYLLFRVAVGW